MGDRYDRVRFTKRDTSVTEFELQKTKGYSLKFSKHDLVRPTKKLFTSILLDRLFQKQFITYNSWRFE